MDTQLTGNDLLGMRSSLRYVFVEQIGESRVTVFAGKGETRQLSYHSVGDMGRLAAFCRNHGIKFTPRAPRDATLKIGAVVRYKDQMGVLAHGVVVEWWDDHLWVVTDGNKVHMNDNEVAVLHGDEARRYGKPQEPGLQRRHDHITIQYD